MRLGEVVHGFERLAAGDSRDDQDLDWPRFVGAQAESGGSCLLLVTADDHLSPLMSAMIASLVNGMTSRRAGPVDSLTTNRGIDTGGGSGSTPWIAASSVLVAAPMIPAISTCTVVSGGPVWAETSMLVEADHRQLLGHGDASSRAAASTP